MKVKVTKIKHKFKRPKCPSCGSTDSYYRVKNKSHLCRRCGAEF